MPASNTLFIGDITGSMFGTASFSTSGSYALSASYTANGGGSAPSTDPLVQIYYRSRFN